MESEHREYHRIWSKFLFLRCEIYIWLKIHISSPYHRILFHLISLNPSYYFFARWEFINVIRKCVAGYCLTTSLFIKSTDTPLPSSPWFPKFYGAQCFIYTFTRGEFEGTLKYLWLSRNIHDRHSARTSLFSYSNTPSVWLQEARPVAAGL